MDDAQIKALLPWLKEYPARIAACFLRSDTRAHLGTYVTGQLSDLPRKSCEPIADAAGIPLQQFLSLLARDHDHLRQKLQQLVRPALKGDASPGR